MGEIPQLFLSRMGNIDPTLSQRARTHSGRHRNIVLERLGLGDELMPVEMFGSSVPRQLFSEDSSQILPVDLTGRPTFAGGGLAKMASLVSPKAKEIYDKSIEFGKEFPRASAEGPGDAARHAYASYLASRAYSPETAEMLGNLYEMASLGSDRRSTRMDQFNNETGRALANLEDEVARQKIRQMIESRRGLQWFDSSPTNY
jgi:hypothetical protein